MMTILTNLDLSCPISWPKDPKDSRKSIIDSASIHISPTKPSHKDGGKGTDLLITDELSITKGEEEDDNDDHVKDDEGSNWIRNRYFETLWLGEQHSPLIGFLMHFKHLQNNLNSINQCANALRKLLRSRLQIRKKNDGWRQKERLLKVLNGDEGDTIDGAENSIVFAALQNGPAKVVNRELISSNSSSSSELGGFGRLWIDAIETRELQLQVLVILCLLRLNAENPNLFKNNPVESNSEQSNDTTSPNQVKRRKRKAEKSHRWTGIGIGGMFPWQQMNANHSKKKSTEDINLTQKQSSIQDTFLASISDPESLSKHFEGMIDALCLRVATTNISLSFDESDHGTPKQAQTEEGFNAEKNMTSPKASILSTPKVPPRTPGESPAALARRRKAAGQNVIIPPFGSEGRRRDSKDETDVLQWFCNQVETNFAKSLPRQCGTLRSRCFISTSVTPAKRINTSSSTKAGQKLQKQIVDSSESRTRKSKNDSDRQQSQFSSSSRRSSSIGPKSSLAELGLLQRSLLDEDRSRLERTQSFAAAKQKTTWDARQVNVRKRWERSQSVGPSSTIGQINSQPTANILKTRKEEKRPIPQVAQVIRGKERSKEDGKERSTFTLVLDTPSKPRPVQTLPIRRKTTMTGSSNQTSTAQSQIISSKNLPRKDFENSWRRSESQPVSTFSSSDLFIPSIPLINDEQKRRNSVMEEDEQEFEDEIDAGMENLDESLRQAFDEDDEDEDFDNEDDRFNIFGPSSYTDWSTLPKRNKEAFEVNAQEQIKDTTTDENEGEERIIITKKARISAPSLLSFSLGSQPLPPQSSSSVLPSSPSRLRKTISSNSPQKRVLSGRNPFAI